MSSRLSAKVTTPKVAADKKGVGKEAVNRGTQDEMEIIGQIITATPGIRTLVFERLKQAKSRHKTREEVLKSRGSANNDD